MAGKNMAVLESIPPTKAIESAVDSLRRRNFATPTSPC